MAKEEIKIPSPGESVQEVEIASWLVSDGDYVEKDQELAEVESDKATLQLVAEASGIIEIKIAEGETTEPGAVACLIDTSAEKSAGAGNPKKAEEKTKEEPDSSAKAEKSEETSDEAGKSPKEGKERDKAYENVKASPLARKKMEEHGLDVEDVINGLRRLSTEDVDRALVAKERSTDTSAKTMEGSRGTERKRMSMLRRKLSERLVGVKNETAMLTTFNEADMSAISKIREKYQRKFQQKHDVKLGFMSFFVKASALALKQFPQVNAMIDGEDIVSHHYADIGIAVQTPKGLMVPVIRNAEDMGLAEIEKEILRLAGLARDGKISLDDLNGGTFSITNGGVFGSLLSTPIINPPQAAILGMHNIQDRPVAEGGQVVIRPMMYLALSYDHRLVDGKDSVSFLVLVKDLLENPLALLSPGGDTYRGLLGL